MRESTSPRLERNTVEQQEGDLRLIMALVTDIEQHNQEHGPGAIIGKTLARTILRESDEETNPEDIQRGVQAEQAASTHVGLTVLRTQHEKTLKRFGLSIEHEPHHYDEETMLQTVLLKITDAKEFVAHIKALGSSVGSVSASGTFKTLLEHIEKQVYFIGMEGTLDREQNVLSQLGGISDALRVVAPSLNFKQIDAYTRFNDTGRLENYIAVEKERLWSEPGKDFGPADWVGDISPKGLEEKWKHALDVVYVQESKRELGVAQELRDHLLKCIALAAEKVNAFAWSQENKKLYLDILVKYTQKLRGNKALN